MPSQRAVLWLWYRGTHFLGWQRQASGRTVQQTVETQLHGRGISSGLAAAGRTDRGVHARQQLASLRVPRATDLDALAAGLGGTDWGCAGAAAAPEGFHAQWTPSRKEYRYRLGRGPLPEGWGDYAWDLLSEKRVDVARVEPGDVGAVLAEAAGTRDFSSFHASSSLRRPRTLSRVECHPDTPVDGLWELRLQGTGFGRYQVRALVAAAALVASGVVPRELWTAALDNAVAFPGLLAPSPGLILWSLDYGGRGPFDGTRPGHLPPGPPFGDGGLRP